MSSSIFTRTLDVDGSDDDVRKLSGACRSCTFFLASVVPARCKNSLDWISRYRTEDAPSRLFPAPYRFTVVLRCRDIRFNSNLHLHANSLCLCLRSTLYLDVFIFFSQDVSKFVEGFWWILGANNFGSFCTKIREKSLHCMQCFSFSCLGHLPTT